MNCSTCDQNISDCRCVDRIERLQAILDSKTQHVSPAYREAIEANIERAQQEKALAE